MKGIIETSIYLIIFALVCFFSIDFIRINQRVSDAGEISQYVENYIEAYCGDVPDKELSMQLRNEKLDMLSRSVQEGGMKLTYGKSAEQVIMNIWNIRLNTHCQQLCSGIRHSVHIKDLPDTL